MRPAVLFALALSLGCFSGCGMMRHKTREGNTSCSSCKSNHCQSGACGDESCTSCGDESCTSCGDAGGSGRMGMFVTKRDECGGEGCAPCGEERGTSRNGMFAVHGGAYSGDSCNSCGDGCASSRCGMFVGHGNCGRITCCEPQCGLLHLGPPTAPMPHSGLLGKLPPQPTCCEPHCGLLECWCLGVPRPGKHEPEPAPGPSAATVGYPYYTTRGPRDFLAPHPPSIGPY
jgi:hypothetical protein